MRLLLITSCVSFIPYLCLVDLFASLSDHKDLYIYVYTYIHLSIIFYPLFSPLPLPLSIQETNMKTHSMPNPCHQNALKKIRGKSTNWQDLGGNRKKSHQSHLDFLSICGFATDYLRLRGTVAARITELVSFRRGSTVTSFVGIFQGVPALGAEAGWSTSTTLGAEMSQSKGPCQLHGT